MTSRSIRIENMLYALLFLPQLLSDSDATCPTPQSYGTGVQSFPEQNKGDQCFTDPPCDPTFRYYSYNGSCNNLLFPTWGQAPQCYLRYTKAYYNDGVYTFRKSVSGRSLPLCRKITNALIKNKEILDKSLNILWYGFGQMCDHDVAHQLPISSSNIQSKNSTDVQCCINGKPVANQSEQVCCPIVIPKDDPFYSKFGVECIDLTRSMNSGNIGCNTTPTCQLNYQTAFMDMSLLYGPDKSTADSLRLFVNGFLNTSNNAETSWQPTYPIVSGQKYCPAGGIYQGLGSKCFKSGDPRINQNPELYMAGWLFLLYHNYVAAVLSKINPHWNDERLYQETRRILIAVFQCITFKEYLVYLIGNDLMQKFNFTLASDGYKDGYDKFLNAGTLDIFSTVCGRILHSLIRGLVPYLSSYSLPTSYQLKDIYFKLEFLLKKDIHLHVLNAYTSEAGQKQDTAYCDDVTEYLLRTVKMQWGMDLVSIDCERGRDWGICPYNELRAAFGLDTFCSFDDFAPYMADKSDAEKFKSVYESINDTDAYFGCLAEKPIPGGIVGPTAAYCLAESFKRWVFGDRYYFEFPSANFTQAQLKSIRKACSIASVICSVYPQIGSVPKDAFRVPSNSNPSIPCFLIPKINLNLWKEYGPSAQPNTSTPSGNNWSTPSVQPNISIPSGNNNWNIPSAPAPISIPSVNNLLNINNISGIWNGV